MPDQETIVRIKRVVSKLARQAGMECRLPLPVWDDSGQMIGVSLEKDKMMGTVMCRCQATFTIEPRDYATDDGIRAKTELGINAINNNILVNIRPKLSVVRQEKSQEAIIGGA